MAAMACVMAVQAVTAIVTEAPPAASLTPTATFWSSASAAPSILAAVAATQQRKRVALKRRHISALWAEYNNLDCTDESEWVAMFRLPRAVFEEVAGKIEGHAVFSAPRNVGERKLSVDKQLAMFLMRVGSNLPISKIRKFMGVSENSVTMCTRRVARAVVSCLGHLLQMPKNGSARKAKVVAMFEATDFGAARGIIDCTHISVNVPTAARRKGVYGSYLNRKGQPTLTFQAIVTPEATPRFLDVSGGYPGSAYDTRLLQRSRVYLQLADYLTADEFLMGDCGYALRPWMMRGWAPTELVGKKGVFTQERWAFNKRYSSVRISVERAFGILKARFKALGGHVRFYEIADYRYCFKACAILHNLCAERKAVRRLRATQ